MDIGVITSTYLKTEKVTFRYLHCPWDGSCELGRYFSDLS